MVGEGSPVSFEIIAVLEKEWRDLGEHEAADALLCAADCWFRWQDIERLLCEDLVIAADGGVSVLLGVRKRGEETKTGPDQGVIPDFARVKDILRRKKRDRKPGDRVFAVSKRRFTALWDSSLAKHGHPKLPPHSLRHSGPSQDAYIGYRGLAEIQKRGRWKTTEGVRRYSKPHLYVQALSMLEPGDMEQGKALLPLWGRRSEMARQ